MISPGQTADAPACPPWCEGQHDPSVGGWERDSPRTGDFYKRCDRQFDLPTGIKWEGVQVSVNRWSSLSIASGRTVEQAMVYIGDGVEMTPEMAEAYAAQLLEAARLARL